jgi:hypothetical protein
MPISVGIAAQETRDNRPENEHSCCRQADKSKPKQQQEPGNTQDVDQ